VQTAKAVKYDVLVSLIVVASLSSVMYALAYTVKHETLYRETLKIGGNGQPFRALYRSAPAVMFEVKLSVSKGSIKWAP